MLDAMLQIDVALRAWLATHHTSPLDALMLGLSALGRGGMVWFALAIALALLRRAQTAAVWRVALAVGLAELATNAAVKPAVGRVRPFEAVMDARVIGEKPTTYSFPSGHAATAVAGALSLGRACPVARPVFWTLAGLIALSRVYVGVHYPLDVIAGALLGLACAFFTLGGRALPEATRAALMEGGPSGSVDQA